MRGVSVLEDQGLASAWDEEDQSDVAHKKITWMRKKLSSLAKLDQVLASRLNDLWCIEGDGLVMELERREPSTGGLIYMGEVTFEARSEMLASSWR